MTALSVTAVTAVTMGTVRSTRRYFVRALGGPLPATVLVLVAVAMGVGLNLLSYFYLDANIGPALTAPAQHGGEENRQLVIDAFISAPLISAAGISLMLVMLVPRRSALGLTARIAGAHRFTVAAGELLPLLASTAVVVVAVGSAPILFLHRVTGIWGTLAFFGVAIACALGMQILKAVVDGLGRWCRLSDEVRHVLALLASMIALAALVLNLLLSVMVRQGKMPTQAVLAQFVHAFWGGAGFPSSPLHALTALLALVGAVVLLLGVQLFGGTDAPTAFPPRIFTLASGRNPRFLGLYAREMLYLIRHPVSQAMFVVTVAFSILFIVATSYGFMPPAAAMLLAALLAADFEAAFGRTARFHWMYHASGYPISRAMLAKYLVSLTVTGGGVLIGLAILAPPTATFENWWLVFLPNFFAFAGCAFLAGTLIPYSDTAAIGLSLASLLTFVLDLSIILLNNLVLKEQPVLQLTTDLTIAILTPILSLLTATKRPPTLAA